jgi:membrane associated rhomboid family serine protease
MVVSDETGRQTILIGASAAISGCMAAAIRFVFQRGGPLALLGDRDRAAYDIPAVPLSAVLRDPRILAFLGVWFGLNLLFGVGSIPLTSGDQIVAWQAHIGGFLVGLLAFTAFDPFRPRVEAKRDDSGPGPAST